MKLLDYRFDEARQLVLWHLQDLTPGTPIEWQQITYAYLAQDLLAQFNVTLKQVPRHVVVKFSEDIKRRTLPFTVKVHATAQLVDPADWKRTATEDWKDEIQRVKNGESYQPGRLLPNNQKLLEAHDEMDRYPFYEVQSYIAEERAKGR